jgi:hypothetical protein
MARNKNSHPNQKKKFSCDESILYAFCTRMHKSKLVDTDPPVSLSHQLSPSIPKTRTLLELSPPIPLFVSTSLSPWSDCNDTAVAIIMKDANDLQNTIASTKDTAPVSVVVIRDAVQSHHRSDELVGTEASVFASVSAFTSMPCLVPRNKVVLPRATADIVAYQWSGSETQ